MDQTFAGNRKSKHYDQWLNWRLNQLLKGCPARWPPITSHTSSGRPTKTNATSLPKRTTMSPPPNSILSAHTTVCRRHTNSHPWFTTTSYKPKNHPRLLCRLLWPQNQLSQKYLCAHPYGQCRRNYDRQPPGLPGKPTTMQLHRPTSINNKDNTQATLSSHRKKRQKTCGLDSGPTILGGKANHD